VIEPVHRIDDPRVADYAKVGDPVWLRAHGLFVAEGRLVVGRLIDARRFDIESLLVTSAALKSLGDAIEMLECPVYVITPAALESLTGFDFHRGCLALARRPMAEPSLDSLAASDRLLALEGVGNPDNVGGLFRVAAAFDAGGVLLDSASADPLYRKAIRTSMGAALRVPFTRVTPWPLGLNHFKRRGFQIAALTPQPLATPLATYAASLAADARVLLMLGAEGPGLTPVAFDMADARVRIPIAARVDSLNVVVAAGIALAALNRSA
jgi:tRNA G18 (ribose-2'-O)-methylase SpoU